MTGHEDQTRTGRGMHRMHGSKKRFSQKRRSLACSRYAVNAGCRLAPRDRHRLEPRQIRKSLSRAVSTCVQHAPLQGNMNRHGAWHAVLAQNVPRAEKRPRGRVAKSSPATTAPLSLTPPRGRAWSHCTAVDPPARSWRDRAAQPFSHLSSGKEGVALLHRRDLPKSLAAMI